MMKHDKSFGFVVLLLFGFSSVCRRRCRQIFLNFEFHSLPLTDGRPARFASETKNPKTRKNLRGERGLHFLLGHSCASTLVVVVPLSISLFDSLTLPVLLTTVIISFSCTQEQQKTNYNQSEGCCCHNLHDTPPSFQKTEDRHRARLIEFRNITHLWHFDICFYFGLTF
jgi:hypothetical protein